MNCHKILFQLRLLSGMDAQEASGYLSLCAACAKSIEKGLRPDADRDDDRLIFAAAASAYYQLCLMRSADLNACDSISVGDVTQSRSYESICKNAKTLCDEAFARISDMTESSNFYFRGV